MYAAALRSRPVVASPARSLSRSAILAMHSSPAAFDSTSDIVAERLLESASESLRMLACNDLMSARAARPSTWPAGSPSDAAASPAWTWSWSLRELLLLRGHLLFAGRFDVSHEDRVHLEQRGVDLEERLQPGEVGGAGVWLGGHPADPFPEERGEDVRLPLEVSLQQPPRLDVGVLDREVERVVVHLLVGVDRLAERLDRRRLTFDPVARRQAP